MHSTKAINFPYTKTMWTKVAWLTVSTGVLGSGIALQNSALPKEPPTPLGTPPPVSFPANNPYSAAKADLGEKLFYEGKMSKTGATPCTWCHVPDQGFGDVRTLSTGDLRTSIRRHTPSLTNVGYAKILFWDGRSNDLEKQSLIPLAAHDEMDMDLNKLPSILKKADYEPLFQAAFGTPDITTQRIAQALATFERTLTENDTPFDRYLNGDNQAMSEKAIQGLKLFQGKANCISCHGGPHFSNAFIPGKNPYANTGVAQPPIFDEDLGRFEQSKLEVDKKAFKIPTLRGIGNSPPYMHTGRFKSLRDVVEFYDRGGDEERLPKLNLTEAEKSALIEFLRRGITSQ